MKNDTKNIFRILQKALFLSVFFIPNISFSAIGTNNFSINVGGNFSFLTVLPNSSVTPSNYLGGGFNIELGHLYFFNSKKLMAMDTRLGYAMNFNNINKVGTQTKNLNSTSIDDLSLYVGTTFMIGEQLSSGRIMVDILGLNIGYYQSTESTHVNESSTIVKSGDNFLLSLNLPLGTTYILNNGIMIGFRQRLDMVFAPRVRGADLNLDGNTVTLTPEKGGVYGTANSQSLLFSYNVVFSLGYVFGK